MEDNKLVYRITIFNNDGTVFSAFYINNRSLKEIIEDENKRP